MHAIAVARCSENFAITGDHYMSKTYLDVAADCISL